MIKLGVPDVRGDYVTVGDTICYGATGNGRSAMIRIGKIIEIVWAHEKPYYAGSESAYTVPTKLRIEVEYSSGWGKPQKPVLIEADFKRFVKVAP